MSIVKRLGTVAVAAVLADKMSVDEAIESLLTRPIKSEE